MELIVTNLGSLASLIGSLTVVGGALMWLYNKFIGKKREEKRQRKADERQLKMLELITEKNEPLNQAIGNLNHLLAESQTDRQHLNEVATENTETLVKHDVRLDNHNDRLIVLETKNGVTTYKEKYRGEHK